MSGPSTVAALWTDGRPGLWTVRWTLRAGPRYKRSMSNWPGAGRATGRLEQRPWRDPRVLLGALLVLVSATAGAFLLTPRDDSVAYWSLARDVRAGGDVQRDDLVESRAELDGAAARHLLRVDAELPARLDDLTWSDDLAAGRLLQRDDLVTGDAVVAELPLAVSAGSAPDDLARGDTVDVWAGPAPGEESRAPARRLLRGVDVVSVGRTTSARGRTVVVDAGSRELRSEVVAGASAAHVTLVRVP